MVMTGMSGVIKKREESRIWQLWTTDLAEGLEQKMLTELLPVFAFAGQEQVCRNIQEVFCRRMLEKVPLYSYFIKEDTYVLHTESEEIKKLLMEEGREETEETEKLQEQWVQGLETENREAGMETEDGGKEKQEKEAEMVPTEEKGQSEEREFVKHEKVKEYDWQALQDYEKLVGEFYAIDSTTMIGSDQLNTEALLGRDLKISKEDPAPQILIYHTHSQEGFADSVPGDASTTIVGAGDRLAQVLESYGYRVLHHTGEYDVENRDSAYAKSLPAIEQLLKDNPSIEVVIDLHRDAANGEEKLVLDLDGRPTARFMFFNGLSRTKKTGNITYLYNENQADNLAFSFQMQVAAGEYYPGLTRKIYLKGYRYNMHVRPRTLLIELGTQNNTREEIWNACDPIAHMLDMVLTGTI